MPARTERQRRFLAAELARKRAGKVTKTKMSAKQLEDFVTLKRPKRKAAK